MPDAAGRFQDVALTESKLFHHLIHGIDNRWRRVESGQSAFPCGSIFLRRQDVFQHPELCLPRTCSLVKGFGNTTPANILGKNDLLVRCGEAVFFLTPFQNGDCRIVAVEAFFLVDLLDLVRSKVKGMTVCHWDFGMNIKGLHPAFLRMLPNRGKGCFHLCKFFLGEINKIVKGQCLQSFFGQFFKGRILHTADDLAVCKSFDADIHKVDPCLYFVLVVLCGGVGNTYIGKVSVIRTVLTLILLTAKIINEMLRLVQSIFRQIRAVDDLKALGRWVKSSNKVIGNRVAVLVLIQNNAHRHTIVAILLDVLFKAIRAGVLDAFTDLAIRAEIVDPADRFGLDGRFLRGGNHGAGNAFTVLQSVDRYIVPSVGQHCKVGFQAVLRKSYHWDTGVVIDGTSSLCQLKSSPDDLCIISIGFKEITHLIQQKATRIVCFGFKIRLIELRQSSILWLFSFCCLLDTLHNALRQVLHIEGDLTFGGDMSNVLIVPIDLHGTVPNGQSVAEIAHPDVILDRFFFGLFFSDLQMVIQRVLLHLAVELSSRHFLVEKRKLRIIEHHTLIIKGQDFILVCAEIDGAAEVVLISLIFRLRLFGRCGRQDFSVPPFFGKLCSALLLPLQPLRVLCLFLGVQVTVEFYQLGNTLLHLTPFQVDMGFIVSDSLRDTDTLTVVLLINTGSDDYGISTAPAVFIFQKVGIFLCRQALLELLIDSHFSLRDAAATGENSVDDLLRESKSRGLSFLCSCCHQAQLPVDGRQWLHRVLQLPKQPHRFKMLGNYAPIIEALRRAGEITALPKLQHILIGLVAHTPSIAQNDLGIVVVENALDIRNTGVLISGSFKECPYLVFACFQVRRGAEDFTNRIIAAKERQAFILVTSVVIV